MSICPILSKYGVPGQIFLKVANIKFDKNPCESGVVTDGQTYRS
jgi:hypothetical protein